MLLTEREKSESSGDNEDSGDRNFFQNTLPIVTSTTLLNSVHLQFVAGCFGLSVLNTADSNVNAQLYHYQVPEHHNKAVLNNEDVC